MTSVPKGLRIPELPPDSANLDHALALADNGIYVLPVKPGTKNPGSVVGDDWTSKSSRDPKTLTAWFAGRPDGIAIDCGRSGLVVIDVDSPESLPERLADALKASGAPYQSTRPDQRGRGHYMFLQPPGRLIGCSEGKLRGCGFNVRGVGGVIMAQPTKHPEGGQYRWESVGEIPVLPDEIAAELPDVSPADCAATDAEVAKFIEIHTRATRPEILAAAIKTFRERPRAASRHVTMISLLPGTMKEVRAGYISAAEAVEKLRNMFIRAKPEGAADFESMLAWAIGQANATDLAAVHERVNTMIPRQSLSMSAGQFLGTDKSPVTEQPAQNNAELPPIPLTDNMAELPAFPVDALPDTFAWFVEELAEATQTDPPMAAVCVLAALSTCAGGHARIQARPGWVEPLVLFASVIARPGERKSAVHQAVTAPLQTAEAELSFAGEIDRLTEQDKYETAKRKADTLARAAANAAAKKAAKEAARDALSDNATDDDRRSADEAIEAAKKEVETAEQAAQEAREALRAITVPEVPRLLADDATPEAVATLLADHGGRISILSTEGGIFETIAGRYARKPNLDVFLKGHAGDPIRVDRQNRPPQHIPRPALTMGLMVQPRVIETIADNADFVGRGLLARFLYALPASKVGHRKIGPPPVSEYVRDQYETEIRSLATKLAEWASDPAMLVLSQTAEGELRRIETAIETALSGEGELASTPTLIEWGSKLAGAVVRIAGLLHLAEYGAAGITTPVEPKSIQAAERIAEYFKASAARVFAGVRVAASPSSDAEYLLGRIESLGKPEVSERDIFTACNRSRFPDKASMVPALKRLVDHGYLIPVQQTQQSRGGRPPSQLYRLNPAANAATPQNQESSRV